MAYGLALLLTSTLTLVGMLAIWLATLRGSWIWRSLYFLVALSPLLLIPALEPYMAFVLQGAIVSIGVTWLPWKGSKVPDVSSSSYRYRLSTVLLSMIPISILAAIVTVSLPTLNPDAWQSIVVIGLSGGLGSFLGWWMATRKAENWRIRVFVASAVFGLLATLTARCDWFVTCIDNLADWPPDESSTDWGFYGVYGKGDSVNAWYFILGAQLLFTNFFVQEAKESSVWLRFPRWPRFGTLAIANFMFLSAIVSTPSLVVGYSYLVRDSVPDRDIRPQNGYQDLLVACDLIPGTRIVDRETFYRWEANEQDLRAASKELDGAIARVNDALKKTTSVDVDYFNPEYPEDLLDSLRYLHWGICIQGRLAQCEANYSHAANRFLDLIAFASASSRSGLIHHDLRSIYAAQDGFRGLYLCSGQLPREEIPKCIHRLRRIDAAYEPAQNYIRRTYVWAQRSRGWYGHLMLLMGEVFHPRLFEIRSYAMDRQHTSTLFCLMQTELAIRAYEADHRHWPEDLENLVPKYLPTVLADPYSPNMAKLRYSRDGDGYSLYSVGPNGIDNGGERAWQSLSYAVHGDVSLTDQFGSVDDSEDLEN